MGKVSGKNVKEYPVVLIYLVGRCCTRKGGEDFIQVRNSSVWCLVPGVWQINGLSRHKTLYTGRKGIKKNFVR